LPRVGLVTEPPLLLPEEPELLLPLLLDEGVYVLVLLLSDPELLVEVDPELEAAEVIGVIILLIKDPLLLLLLLYDLLV
jgi:hypothetical protein